jgi:hypothetical protein
VKHLDVVAHDVTVLRQRIHGGNVITGHEPAVARNIRTENGAEFSSGSFHGNQPTFGIPIQNIQKTQSRAANPYRVSLLYIFSINYNGKRPYRQVKPEPSAFHWNQSAAFKSRFHHPKTLGIISFSARTCF